MVADEVGRGPLRQHRLEELQRRLHSILQGFAGIEMLVRRHSHSK